MSSAEARDHGGGLDQAVREFGGTRADWIDLSTGVNPVSYPLPDIPNLFWTDLPDSKSQHALLDAARSFWSVPNDSDITAAAGVSALIAQLPRLGAGGSVGIYRPTYNEHEASFAQHGWTASDTGGANVYVHPNNPDGRRFSAEYIRSRHKCLTVIDESFCDVAPDETRVALASEPGYVILKGLGKFWGLAGLRLGFAISTPETAEQLRSMLGPWAVSGPAQHIGTAALSDVDWAQRTRARLAQDRKKLDTVLCGSGLVSEGGTDLFGLYTTSDARALQAKLAHRQIWTRVFPYSETLIRFGLPGPQSEWDRLKSSLREE